MKKENSKNNNLYKNNIDEVKIILNIIGSPFNESKNIELVNYAELYGIAQKNKIGLLFLESLFTGQIINGLQSELDKQRLSHNHLRTTAERVGYILNKARCKYAIIKSNFPFPAVPNDVDVLIFGDNEEYNNAIEQMKVNQFEPLTEVEAPLELCLHDTSRAKHIDPMIKDPFDVDIYKEIGAGHVIYMNKMKLINQITETTINNTKVNTLNPTSEMALSIFHSIYPEKIYTLLLHFFILHTIKQMSSTEKEKFLQICNDLKIRNAALLTLSLTESIQEICFGDSPSELTDLRTGLGKRKAVKVDRLPYHYPTKDMVGAFLGKTSDPEFMMSAVRQVIAMLNPKYANYVIGVYKERMMRETY